MISVAPKATTRILQQAAAKYGNASTRLPIRYSNVDPSSGRHKNLLRNVATPPGPAARRLTSELQARLSNASRDRDRREENFEVSLTEGNS